MSETAALAFGGVMALSTEQSERGNGEEMRGSIQKYVDFAWANYMCPFCPELAPRIKHVQNGGSCILARSFFFVVILRI